MSEIIYEPTQEDMAALAKGERLTPPDPGIYHHVPAPIYHSWGCASNSTLKPIIEREKKWRQYEFDRRQPRAPETAQARRIGGKAPTGRTVSSVLHELVLLPDLARVVEMDTRNKNSNDYKEWEQGVLEEHPTAWIVEKKWYDYLRKLADWVLEHRELGPIIKQATDKELTLRWADRVRARKKAEEGGFEEVPHIVQCKGLMDLWHRGEFMADLKFMASCDEDDFRRVSANGYRYDIQDAFYRRGALANGRHESRFLFIVIQKPEPFDFNIVEFTGREAGAAEDELAVALEQLASCEVNGHWPGHGEAFAFETILDDVIPLHYAPWREDLTASRIQEWNPA